MSEINNDVSNEVGKNVELNNYLSIKPEGKINIEDCYSFLDSLIKDKIANLENQETVQDKVSISEIETKGGSYKELKKAGYGDATEPPTEIHHTPADSASKLERDDGPAIAMEKKDHQKTASFGSSREAKEYREVQKQNIDSGNIRKAIEMDINDLRSKFGNKYDKGIEQMLKYVDQLETNKQI